MEAVRDYRAAGTAGSAIGANQSLTSRLHRLNELRQRIETVAGDATQIVHRLCGHPGNLPDAALKPEAVPNGLIDEIDDLIRRITDALDVATEAQKHTIDILTN